MASKKNGLVQTIGVVMVFISGICIFIGFFQCVQLINDQWGLPMAAVSLLVIPATVSLVPLYAGFTLGNWGIIALVWGGALGISIGKGLSGE